MTQREIPPPKLAFPERVGRYELLAPLGTGGMATVYLARTPLVDDLHRELALKLMHPQLMADDGAAARNFVQEAKIAARIRHPNAVPVLEVGHDPAGIFLVMEAVRGDSLSGLLRAAKAARMPLTLPVIGRILSDALLGLHAAHELTDEQGRLLNLVHRDVSPQNVLVGIDGVTRITDFGVAKSSAQTTATAAGVAKGKVSYMAPEQARGEPVDRRTDIWAVGVMAWELFAGRRMHTNPDPMATLLRIVSEPAPKLREVRSAIPVEIDVIVARALSMRPSERFVDADDFRQHLLRAFRAADGIAEHAEVAAFVEALIGPKLEQQRQLVAEVLAQRAERQSAALGVLQNDEPTARTVTFERQVAEGSRRRWLLGAGAASVIVAGIALAAARLSTRAAVVAPPVVQPAAAPSATSEASPVVPRELSVDADRAIESITAGNRTLAFSVPSRSLKLALAPDLEQGFELSARAVDGREARAAVAAGETHVELTFGELPKPAKPSGARAAARAPRAAPRASALPGIVSSPYAKP